MSRRLVLVLVLVAVLAVGLIALVMGFEGSDPDSGRGASPAPTAEAPTTLAPETGDAGSRLGEGFVVVEGSLLVEEPEVRESESVRGFFANLDLTGDPQQVLDGYRSQLLEQGYQVVRDEVVAEGPAAGTLSLEAHRMGTLPGAVAPVAVDVVQVDVVPAAGEVPGYVRFLFTHLKS